MQWPIRSSVMLFAGALFVIAPAAGDVYGQAPSATISSPTDNATVNVGGGSQPMLVKVQFPAGDEPVWCRLMYETSDGYGWYDLDVEGTDWYFESPTGLHVARVHIPPGTKSGLIVKVQGYKQSNSGGFPGGVCYGQVTNVTVTKLP